MAKFEAQKKAAEQEAARSRALSAQVSTFSQTESELRNQLNIYVEKFKQVRDDFRAQHLQSLAVEITECLSAVLTLVTLRHQSYPAPVEDYIHALSTCTCNGCPLSKSYNGPTTTAGPSLFGEGHSHGPEDESSTTAGQASEGSPSISMQPRDYGRMEQRRAAKGQKKLGPVETDGEPGTEAELLVDGPTYLSHDLKFMSDLGTILPV
jgi:hypothetical protein